MRRVPQRVAFATLVLMVAIAGAAAAAGTITGASIKDNSVTGKDIKNHSLTAVDFKDSPSKLTTVSNTAPVAPMSAAGGTVKCPAGSRVVSGGFASDGGVVFISRPSDNGQGWDVALANPDSSSAVNLTGYASCSGAGKAVAARTSSTRWHETNGRVSRLVLAHTR